MQPTPSQADDLIARAAAALRAGDKAAAAALLADAIRADPGQPRAWLWLSGAVPTAAEQRFCLERAAALDPSLSAAQRGLAALAAVAPARPALLTPAPPAPSPRPAPAGPPALAGPIPPPARSIPPARAAPPPIVPPAPAPARPAQPVAPAPLPPAPPPPAPRAELDPRAGYLNPWVWIWAQPGPALRSAICGRSALETIALAGLAGINGVLAWAALRGLGAGAPPASLLLLALLAGPPLALGALLLGGVILRIAGRWLGGRGVTGGVRAALAWAGAPLVAGLPIWVLQLALLPGASFGGARATGATGLLAAVAGAIHIVLWAWAALLAVLGVAEAHRFGPLRGALTWLAAGVLMAGGAALVLAGAALIILLRTSAG